LYLQPQALACVYCFLFSVSVGAGLKPAPTLPLTLILPFTENRLFKAALMPKGGEGKGRGRLPEPAVKKLLREENLLDIPYRDT
jgi:hypothetical protein